MYEFFTENNLISLTKQILNQVIHILSNFYPSLMKLTFLLTMFKWLERDLNPQPLSLWL